MRGCGRKREKGYMQNHRKGPCEQDNTFKNKIHVCEKKKHGAESNGSPFFRKQQSRYMEEQQHKSRCHYTERQSYRKRKRNCDHHMHGKRRFQSKGNLQRVCKMTTGILTETKETAPPDGRCFQPCAFQNQNPRKNESYEKCAIIRNNRIQEHSTGG